LSFSERPSAGTNSPSNDIGGAWNNSSVRNYRGREPQCRGQLQTSNKGKERNLPALAVPFLWLNPEGIETL
jgi:hypothetical protein